MGLESRESARVSPGGGRRRRGRREEGAAPLSSRAHRAIGELLLGVSQGQWPWKRAREGKRAPTSRGGRGGGGKRKQGRGTRARVKQVVGPSRLTFAYKDREEHGGEERALLRREGRVVQREGERRRKEVGGSTGESFLCAQQSIPLASRRQTGRDRPRLEKRQGENVDEGWAILRRVHRLVARVRAFPQRGRRGLCAFEAICRVTPPLFV